VRFTESDIVKNNHSDRIKTSKEQMMLLKFQCIIINCNKLIKEDRIKTSKEQMMLLKFQCIIINYNKLINEESSYYNKIYENTKNNDASFFTKFINVAETEKCNATGVY